MNPEAQNKYDTLEGVNTRATELMNPPTPAPSPIRRSTVGTTGLENDYRPRYANNSTPSVDQVQSQMMQSAQGEINALKEYENTRLQEQSVINQQNDRSTSSISTLTGLGGSTEANVQQQKTTAQGEKANQAIRAEAQARIQGILTNVRQSAITEARAMREEARMDEETRIKTRAMRQKEAMGQLTNLVAGGVTFEGMKSDKEGFAYLASQFGGEDALKGAFLLNTPQDQILDKRIEAGKYVVAKQNPLTGKITVETLDLGLPPQYTKTIDAGNRILAIPDGWDGDPSSLISIAKGLTPSQSLSSSSNSSSNRTSVAGLDPSAPDYILNVLNASAGGKSVDVTTRNQLTKAATVLQQLSDLSGLMTEETTGPFLGIIRSNNPYDVKAQQIKAQLTAIVPNLARGVYGEVGVLTDNDIRNYTRTLGNLQSTEDVNKLLTAMTVKTVLRSLENQLEIAAGTGLDVSGLKNIYSRLSSTANQLDASLSGGDLRSRVDQAGYDYEMMKADGISDEEIETLI